MKLGTTFLFPKRSISLNKNTKNHQPSSRQWEEFYTNHNPPFAIQNCIQEHRQTTRTDDVGGQVEGFFLGDGEMCLPFERLSFWQHNRLMSPDIIDISSRFDILLAFQLKYSLWCFLWQSHPFLRRISLGFILSCLLVAAFGFHWAPGGCESCGCVGA